eukprot:12903656-Prorocentrum_lima.AAC.1
MVATFSGILNIRCLWDDDQRCFITSHDQEAGDKVELYLPLNMAHWHNSGPHELQADEQLVLT